MSYFYVMPKGDQISLAWGDETKDTVFGGIAWSGHNADLAACQEADARISELENRLDGERVHGEVGGAALGPRAERADALGGVGGGNRVLLPHAIASESAHIY